MFCLCQHKLLYSHYTKIISKALLTLRKILSKESFVLTFVLKYVPALDSRNGFKNTNKMAKDTNLDDGIIRVPEFGFF